MTGNRIWMVGDFVYCATHPNPLRIKHIMGDLCICENNEVVVTSELIALSPTPYVVRGGIVYDGDIPVGVL
jgi:hypothetical protein